MEPTPRMICTSATCKVIQCHANKPVPDADQYYPLNDPVIGSVYHDAHVYPQNIHVPALFHPITLKGVTFKNRIFVAPMCQYSSDNGHATDWHLVHIGGFATRGAGSICMEATAVVPEGRITPEDAGLWTDSQMAPLERIVNFVHAHGTKIGIQLSHAGRKASTLAPWIYSDVAMSRKMETDVASEAEGGWPDRVCGPSDIQFSDEYPKPKEMPESEIKRVEDAFIAAIHRCQKIGFDFIEIHAAHGYLIHAFLSPLSNTRTDTYGGPSLPNRMSFPLRLIKRAREAWPSKPLFVRISATDWAEGPEKGEDGEWKQWGVEQSKVFVGEMVKIGVDFVDVSTGGNWIGQNITVGPGYQVPFAETIKKAYPNLPIGTVGLITDPHLAESYLQDGKADVVSLAREMLRMPHWPMMAAQELGVAVKVANQYERAWTRMLKPRRN